VPNIAGAASRTKSCIFRAYTDDEHVKGDLGFGGVALDLRLVINVDDALLVVDLGGLGFVVLDGGLLVAQKVADRLHDGAVLNGADGARGEQRGEEEVVAWGDDNDVVVFRVELLQQGDGAPAGAEHDERLLARVGLGLVLGVACLVDAVAHIANGTQGGEVGEAPCPAEEAEASPRLGRCGVGGGPADGLAQGNLVLDGAGGPLRAVGDERRARRRSEGAAAGQLHLRHQLGSSKGPHGGSH
jgi:hypothetical protein